MNMNIDNMSFQPLSPVSDNDEWLKYIDSGVMITSESDSGSVDGSIKQEFGGVLDSYLASNSSPEDFSYSDSILDLDSVNDKLTTATKSKKSRKRAPRKKLTTSQKAAHNVIEKKYRININTKIEGLQRIIPWLTGEENGFKTQTKDINDDSSNKRLNKSLILDKAIEYIEFLQLNESRILDENLKMKNQLFQLNQEFEV